MGTVFQVPWTWIEQPQQQLNALGFQTAAMALTDQSIPLDAPCLKQIERLALIMGTEGDGLPEQTIAAADHVVRIPMKHGVDSLNVAAAMAVACWELSKIFSQNYNFSLQFDRFPLPLHGIFEKIRIQHIINGTATRET